MVDGGLGVICSPNGVGSRGRPTFFFYVSQSVKGNSFYLKSLKGVHIVHSLPVSVRKRDSQRKPSNYLLSPLVNILSLSVDGANLLKDIVS